MLSTFALVALICTGEGYCHESVISVWDNRVDCMVKGIPDSTFIDEKIDNVTFYCVDTENLWYGEEE